MFSTSYYMNSFSFILISISIAHKYTRNPRHKPRDLAVDKIKILFDNQIQQKHSKCVVGRFAVSTYRRKNEKGDHEDRRRERRKR